jgi:hypothetical protein
MIKELRIEVEEEVGSDSEMTKGWPLSISLMRYKELNFVKELRTLGPSFV